MKPTITFEHVATNKTGRIRIYRASRALKNKANGKRYRNERETVKFYRTKERDSNDLIERHLSTTFRYVAVSDAHTHIERLAFPCWFMRPLDEDGLPYFWQCDTIAGVNTFMIYGGDSMAVKPDQVYLRMLATGNGFQYKRNNTGETK